MVDKSTALSSASSISPIKRLRKIVSRFSTGRSDSTRKHSHLVTFDKVKAERFLLNALLHAVYPFYAFGKYDIRALVVTRENALDDRSSENSQV